MPCDMKSFPDYLRLDFSGRVALADFDSLLEPALKELRRSHRALADLRAIDAFDFGFSGTRRLARDGFGRTEAPSRLALVAEQGAVFGMARMLGSLVERFYSEHRVRVFNDELEALHWLCHGNKG